MLFLISRYQSPWTLRNLIKVTIYKKKICFPHLKTTNQTSNSQCWYLSQMFSMDSFETPALVYFPSLTLNKNHSCESKIMIWRTKSVIVQYVNTPCNNYLYSRNKFNSTTTIKYIHNSSAANIFFMLYKYLLLKIIRL